MYFLGGIKALFPTQFIEDVRVPVVPVKHDEHVVQCEMRRSAALFTGELDSQPIVLELF